MFKRLRNKLLVTNLAITVSLVVCCLTAIFITTYSYVLKETNRRLDRAVEMSIQRIEHGERMQRSDPPRFDEIQPQREPDWEGPRRPDDADKFSAEFSVYADAEGDAVEAITNFNMDESDYADVVKYIVQSGRRGGSIRLDIDSWAYKVVPFGEGYIVAFSQNSAQRRILFILVVILILAAAVSTAATFLISLFSANRSIRPIEDSYNKQKQFVADASHELRTPLASISANADVLLSKPESTIAEERKWLEYIKDETDRMTRLTNDLLCLARSDADNATQLLSEVSFSDIAEDVALESEAAAFEAGRELVAEIAPDIRVRASEGGLKQLVLILVDNALKYASENGSVKMTLKRDGAKAVFIVENTGEIDKADLPHIFERFYRADKSRSRESGGYGLGLSIADSLCAGFGGKLRVKSGGGKTSFWFELENK